MTSPDRRIYLASKSPRRLELLQRIGVACDVLLPDTETDETVAPGETADDYVARVTRDKAAAASCAMKARGLPPRPILAADTTVALEQSILGKPAGAAEAAAMLQRLSGRTHRVLTSVVVMLGEQQWQTTQISQVFFDDLTPQRIQAYCNTGEPYDKAGAYGIQGIASVFIRDIAGSHSGIMGLPLFETAQLLQSAGLDIL